eukprot:1195675-Prorocentrum_minimum.AAC.1
MTLACGSLALHLPSVNSFYTVIPSDIPEEPPLIDESRRVRYVPTVLTALTRPTVLTALTRPTVLTALTVLTVLIAVAPGSRPLRRRARGAGAIAGVHQHTQRIVRLPLRQVIARVLGHLKQ